MTRAPGVVTQPRRVVLVTHDASRTGAPMVALLIARCLVERGDRVAVVSRRAGPLTDEFARVAPTHYEVLRRVRRRLWLKSWLRHVAWVVDVSGAVATLALHRPDLVYLNSTAAAVYVHAARWLKVPVVLHVHESETHTQAFLAEARVRDLAGVHLIACSPSVEEYLAQGSARTDGSVHLLPSVPDTERLRVLAAEPGTTGRRKTGLVVGATGGVGHRKGTDLWLQVADIVHGRAAAEEVSFVWVGELGEPLMARSRHGVEFAGGRANPYPDMAAFDVATLPSRDDPFPLVVLESMLLGKPVVAFDVGGVRQQVGEGGVVVPPGDVDAFARAVEHLVTDHDARHTLGTAARERAETLYSSGTFASRLDEILLAVDRAERHLPSTASRQAR